MFNMIICTKDLLVKKQTFILDIEFYKFLFMKQVWFAADLLTLTSMYFLCFFYLEGNFK